MKFDEILKELGEFGFYQKRLYLLLCLPAITVGCFMMMNVILLGSPKHRCKIPFYPDDTWEIQDEMHQKLINQTIPPSDDYDYDRCHVYVTGYVEYDNITNKPMNATKYACTEWVYDTAVFLETFTSKHNLVCEDALKTSHAQLIFYFGVLVGDLGFGLLSDIIGRKKTLCIASVVQVASALGAAWAPNFVIYVILEFIIGAACHGVFMCCCVLGLELVGPSKRVWTGILIHAFFAVGLCYLSGVSWLLRNWYLIQIVVAAPCGMYLLYWWIIPESPRWLLSMGRKDEADQIMRKAAKVNKTTLPEKIFDTDTVSKVKGGKIWQLFTHRVLFIRTMIILFNWVIVSMTYYGVTMYAGNLGGDFYLNFFLLAVVEFPAKAFSIAFLDRLGRKWVHFIYMMLGGLACIGTIFTVIYGGEALHPLTIALALVGKLGPAGAFGVIYVFSAELYPTVLRNAGMGTSSCVARFGGMAAPYVAKMAELFSGDVGKALPLAIFGISSVLAGLLCLLLPETLNQKLPDTIEEAIHFKGNKRRRIADKEVEVEVNDTTVNTVTHRLDVKGGLHHVDVVNGVVNKGYANGDANPVADSKEDISNPIKM